MIFRKKRVNGNVYCKDCRHYRRYAHKSIINDDYCFEFASTFEKVDPVKGLLIGTEAGFEPALCKEKNINFQCQGYNGKNIIERYLDEHMLR